MNEFERWVHSDNAPSAPTEYEIFDAGRRYGMEEALRIARKPIKCRSADGRRKWERDKTVEEIVRGILFAIPTEGESKE